MAVNRAMLCKSAGPFCAHQPANDLLDASGWPVLSASCCARVEEWYNVDVSTGTIRVLNAVYDRQLRKAEYVPKLVEFHDRLNDDRRKEREEDNAAKHWKPMPFTEVFFGSD